MNNDDDEEEAYVAISNMLELEGIAAAASTENESENSDPVPSTVDSNSYPKNGPSASAKRSMANAKNRFHDAQAHILRMRGRIGFEEFHFLLVGPQEHFHLVYYVWMDFQKYVKQHAGWKLRRREACTEEKLVANQGTVSSYKRFVITAICTPFAFQQQPMLPAVVAGSNSNSNSSSSSSSSSNVASTESLQSEQSTVVTTAATTADSLLMESTNVQPHLAAPAVATTRSTNAVSSKPPARTTMLPRTTSIVDPSVPRPGAHMSVSPFVYPSPSVYPSQLPTTTDHYSNSSTTTPTDSFLQYGDLATFPILNITPRREEQSASTESAIDERIAVPSSHFSLSNGGVME
jgi:hypothetical protein